MFFPCEDLFFISKFQNPKRGRARIAFGLSFFRPILGFQGLRIFHPFVRSEPGVPVPRDLGDFEILLARIREIRFRLRNPIRFIRERRQVRRALHLDSFRLAIPGRRRFLPSDLCILRLVRLLAKALCRILGPVFALFDFVRAAPRSRFRGNGYCRTSRATSPRFGLRPPASGSYRRRILVCLDGLGFGYFMVDIFTKR